VLIIESRVSSDTTRYYDIGSNILLVLKYCLILLNYILRLKRASILGKREGLSTYVSFDIIRALGKVRNSIA
jgi:hypothetical protein